MYKIKDLDKPVVSGRFSLKYHMVEIQSPLLVSALCPIVKDQDVHLDPSETAVFQYPFRALYFCSDKIMQSYKKQDDGPGLKQHLALLLKIMGDLFGNVHNQVKSLQASKLISFKLAWAYFLKDSMMYSPGKDCERIRKIVDTTYKLNSVGKPYLSIKCKEIVFDGETFIWQDDEVQIATFDGNKPIKELSHYPLSFHDDPKSVIDRLTARGQRVLDYQGLTYCEYEGLAIYEDDDIGIQKHNVSARILIDTYGYQKHHRALKRRGGRDQDSLNNKVLNDAIPIIINNHQLPPPPPPPPAIVSRKGHPPPPNAQAALLGQKPKSLYIKRLDEEDQARNKKDMLAREQDLVFLSPLLPGYALKNKLWCKYFDDNRCEIATDYVSVNFYVDDIKPVQWNDDAYEHLVYEEESKDLVLTFVENHQNTKKEMDDVIIGKGQGLVILLSGPPGTGKTLTAEAVADKTRRPFYHLQAEDLGINAALLGERLKKIFEMATEWDAVILLDEADVFMAERNPNDIARNELVSIFLRELEYYRGIIFLTTNLYDTIDAAFRSRVNIHLLFSRLSESSRLLVWRKFLQRLPPPKRVTPVEEDMDSEGDSATPSQKHDIDEEDLEELSKWQLNGREIKNAIKTVKTWCDTKGYEINLTRLESGIKVTAPHASKAAGGSSELYDM